MERAGGGGAPPAELGADWADQIDLLLAGQNRLEEQLGAVEAAVLQALAAAERRICGEQSARLREDSGGGRSESSFRESSGHLKDPGGGRSKSSLHHESSGHLKAYSDAAPMHGIDIQSALESPSSQLSLKPKLVSGSSASLGIGHSAQGDAVQRKRSSPKGLASRTTEGAAEMQEHRRQDSLSADVAFKPRLELERARQHPWSALRSFCQALVNSNTFEPCMGLLIIINTISVGVGIQNDLDGDDSAMTATLDVLEHVLLAGFLVELVIRMMANGRKCWNSLWFITDFVLVLVGVIVSWVVQPILSASSNSVSELENVKQFLVIRILRLIRLVRALRLIDYFQELWKLTKGLITSGRTVISAIMMVTVVIYAFACFGVETIYTSESLLADPVTAEIVETSFHSLPVTMLTLAAFANADSVASIYVPLCQIEPGLIFFFCSLWLVVTVSLMNLVTAVIVETAIAGASEDAEMDRKAMRKQLKKLIPAINDVFMKLDTDNEGTLTRDELSQAHIDWPLELQKTIQTDKLVDLFEFLDVDDSGQIDRKEFVDGVCHLALSSVPIETTQMLQLLRQVNTRLETIEDALDIEPIDHRKDVSAGQSSSGADLDCESI